MASLKLSTWVTNECNMRCKYCYEDSSQGKDIDIDENNYVDNLIKFIQMATQNIPTDRVFIKLFGGEPFLLYLSSENRSTISVENGSTIKLVIS